MDEEIQSGEGYDSKREVKSGSDMVTFWTDAIALSEKAEKAWRADAANVISVYRGEKGESGDSDYSNDLDFNILHANVETILPAIYNSSPTPDIRRRFGDKDPVARSISQILERSISYFQDQYDFDATMNGLLFDGAVAGRGVARVRYIPHVSQGENGDNLDSEEIRCEYVNWQRFRCGKADTWDEMPWIAFEHFLNKDELAKITKPEVIQEMSFDYSARDNANEEASEVPDVYRRARVWEIWDKESRKVLFVAPGYAARPVAEHDDPLQLQQFFPIPRPIMPVYTPGKMTPVCPYSIYRALAEELNSITRRIKRLVSQIRVKGAYAGGQADLARLADADDGELVGAEGLEAFLDGGIDKAIAWWPIEPAVKALQQLYIQREQVKTTIYEVTGISDIVRGQSAASETATAQQIKTQWGSLRIQKLQNEVQRFARDLYRIKAEIIANHFHVDSLARISGIKLLSQQEKQQIQQEMQMNQEAKLRPEIEKALKEPSIEEVEQVLRDDLMRAYRVDIESDSTIRSDMTRHQKTMQEFLQGTSQYLQAAAPIVQAGIMEPQPLVEIYASFARMFKLGKQADDALDQLGESARENKDKPQKPNPAAEQQKAEMAMKQKESEMRQQEAQAKLQMEGQKAQMDAQAAQAKAQMDAEIAREKMLSDAALEREKMERDYELARERMAGELEIKRMAAEESAEIAAQSANAKNAIAAKAVSRRPKASEAN